MKLEQQMYEISRIGKERIYSIGNLENLSATALYYGEGGGSSGFSGGFNGGGFGGIGKKECNEFGIVKTPSMKNSELLTIRPLPSLGADLHIHPDSGAGSIKPFGSSHGYPLTNYETAMADLYADLLKIPKIKK